MKNESRLTPFMRIVALAIAMVVPLGTAPVTLNAATFFWDPTLAGGPAGGAGTWDTSTANWWDGASNVAWPNVVTDTAAFSSIPFAAPAAPYAVTVSSGIIANKLSFQSSGYTLTGGDITLGGTAPGIEVFTGEAAQIDSQINGTGGLTLTGGGTVRLTNVTNGYTGTTTLADGTLIISNQAQLGADSSAIMVTGYNPALTSTNLRGFGGGSLYLDGMTGPVVITRALSLQGNGPISDRGAALVSAGDNTVSGAVTMGTPFGATNLNTRVISAGGNLNLSGTLNILGTAGTTLSSFGGVNTAGLGSYNITGILTGTGTIEKLGGGTLFLNPSDSSGYSGIVSTGAAGVGQSEIRITSPDVLGTRVNTGTTSVVDLNGGILSVFMDTPSVNAGGLPANVYAEASTSLYVNHTPGSSVQNQTVAFGQLAFEENITVTFTGGNGYNISFGAAPVQGGTNNSTFTNSLTGGGELTFTGAFWSNTNNTAARTLTMNGVGNTILTGNLVASATSFDHILTKAGTGTLTIRSTAGTLDGAVNTSGGALAITDFRSINLASTSAINIGTGGTAGILNFGTSTASTAAGLTSAVQGVTVAQAAYVIGTSTVTLRSVTGVTSGATITGTGIAPGTTITSITGNVVTLSANATAAGAINTALTVSGVQNTRVINLAGTTGGATINANQTAGSPVIIAAGSPTTVAVSATGAGAKTLTLGGTSTQQNAINGAIVNSSAATSVTKADAGTWVLNGVNTYTGATTLTQGILRLNANAGASTIIAESATNTIVFTNNATTQSAGGNLQFNGFSAVATTETLGALTPTNGAATITLTGTGGSPANLIFTSLGTVGKGSGVNFVTTAAVGGTITLTGQATTTAVSLPGNGGHLYFNGADFAVSTVGVMGAPTYTAGGLIFTTAPTALTAGRHNVLTGDIGAQAAVAVTSLKLTTNTLTLAGNLTVATVAGLDGGILQTGGTGTIGGAGLITSGGAGTLVFRVNLATDILNLNTNIAAATTGGFTKNGLGKLVINAVNAQTGATTINEGTVQLTGTGRLSGNNVATVLRQGATLDLNGLTTQGSIAAFDGAGLVTNSNAADATLLLGGTTTGAGIFSGIIQDGLGITNVTLNGTTGSPTWSGANTYTGVTSIGNNTLATAKVVNTPILANYGTASSIGRGIQTIVDDTNNAASLVFNGTTGGINYTGLDPVSIDRLFTLNSSQVGGGGQIANSSSTNASLIFNKTNALTFGAGATGVVQTLTLGGTSSGDNEFKLQIVDNGGTATNVSKIGTGIWKLGNLANTNTGTTTIAQGFLDAIDGTSLSNASGLILGNITTAGVLKSSGNFIRNVVVSGSAGVNTVSWNANLTTAGSGFSSNDQKLTIAFGGVGTESPLLWGTGGFATSSTPTAALILNSATALAEIEWRNPIDLNALLRTIQVDDNTSVATDFASITSVISGGGTSGINKTGAGILRLLGDNTYVGNTAVQGGQLIVKSLGSSTGGGSSSVGAGGVTMDDTNAITLGNGVNTGGVLQYLGAGEISDRKIRLNTTNATNQIHADGTGPLILTNVANDMTAAITSKTLALRGTNAAGNMITSQLSDNGGPLNILVDGSATWILTNPANNYTGTTTVSAGALGVGDNAALGTGTLVFNNGNIFAYGADRVISNPLIQANNTTTGFIGDYGFLFTSVYASAAAANGWGTNNNLAAGKAINFVSGVTANSITGNRAWTIDGSGETIITGDFTTSTNFGVPLAKTGSGRLQLGGATSSWNNNGAVIDIDNGVIQTLVSNAIPSTATNGVAGGVTFSPELSQTDTATLDLNGTAQVITALTAITDGSAIIDNTSASPASLTFGASNAVANFGAGAGSYTISNSGGGALSLTKTGTGAATIAAGVTLSYTGATSVVGTGTFTISTMVGATTALSVSGGGTLALAGGMTTPSAVTSVFVDSQSTLSLLDSAGNQLTSLTSLTLGSAAATTTFLNLNVGDITGNDMAATDTLTLLTGGVLSLTAGNTITLNLADAGLNGLSNYNLISAVDGGLILGPLGAADWLLGATPGGFASITLNKTDTLISITTGALITGTSYWRGLLGGGVSDTWNGSATNWSTDKAGTIAASSVPGAGTDVVFQWDAPSNAAVATTLEGTFKINSLTFEASTTPANTPTSVTIEPGVVPTNRIEVAPQLATDGVKITAGGPPVVTITAPVKLGNNQTWNVADAASVLTFGGSFMGEKDVTKTGLGKVTISGAADSTFNAGLTADFTVSAGTLEFTVAGALGTTVLGNAANINVASGGTFYYNNAVSGTVNNPLQLSGGTLSAAGNTQTYNGLMNVSADSFINLINASSAVLTDPARSITLSGAISGAGKLTVNGNSALTAGNAEGGTLTLNTNLNASWSGGVQMDRGTIVTTFANGLGTGPMTFNQFGRIIVRAIDGTTYTYANSMNFNSGAVGEFSTDNTGLLASNFTVNQTGVVNLGSGTGSTIARLNLADAASTLNITGGVVLKDDASLTVEGGDADSLVTISGIGISEVGGARTLNINDEAGAWAVTSGRLRIDASGSYTGGTTLTEGRLILGIKDALGTGALTINANSTLEPGVDLSGVNTVLNPLNLGNGVPTANLTVAGSNSITMGGLTTVSGNNRTVTNSLTAGTLRLANVQLAELATARTLTVAGVGTTEIGTVTNFGADNTLTNSNTTVPLTIDTNVFLSDDLLTGRTLTLAGAGATNVTGVIADANGVGLAGNLTYSGSNVLTLTGANTFSGTLAVNSGTVDFTTASNVGGGASNLGQGPTITMGIPASGTAGVLRFIGSSSQSTNRAITQLGNATFNASGTGGAVITYAGAITSASNSATFTGTAGSQGVISGGYTHTDDVADITVSGATWAHQTATSRVGDDVTVTGATTIFNLDSGLFQVRDDFTVTAGGTLNLNGTGVLSFNIATLSADASLRATNGGIINLFANDSVVVTGFDGLRIGTDAAGTGTFAMGAFNQTVFDFLLGNRQSDRIGNVTGTGNLTVTGGFDLYQGTIDANLVQTGADTMNKTGNTGIVTLKGDNSGLSSTGGTVVFSGTLALDYTVSNTTKINSAAVLDMRGGTLQIIGNNGAATTQSVASTTLATNGASVIQVTGGTGQDAVLNLGAITRAGNANDGTLRFILPTGTQSATNGITTTSSNNVVTAAGILGGWATVNDGTGVFFARNDGSGNVVAANTNLQNTVASWVTGDNISDDVGGYTGTITLSNINSLRFNDAVGSNLVMADAGVLSLATGGLLVTSNVGGTPTFLGGTLVSGLITGNVPELIVTQDSASVFELGADLRLNQTLVKSGSGTLRLSGNNVATGYTDILDGIVQVIGGNAIGDSSIVTLNANRNATLQLLQDETIGRLQGGLRADGEDNGFVAIGGNTLTINESASTTYSGRFTGAGSLVMGAGNTGNLNMNGASTGFTGSVVASGGLFQLSGSAGATGALNLTINRGGAILLDNNDNASITTRLVDTSSIFLNSADGAFSGATLPRGLSNREDDNVDATETYGALFINSGASYVTLEPTNAGGTTQAGLTAATGWTRSNSATIDVRGIGLGATAGPRAQFKVANGNDAAMIAANVGGTGVVGTSAKDVAIVPWAIGENLTGALANTNMGNTLLSYVDNRGFVPLDFATEYSTFGTVGGATDNVRESLAADLTGLITQTVNAVVLHNATLAPGPAINVMGSGPGISLGVTSGALLFTLDPTAAAGAYGTTLGGYDAGITVGGTNEYVIHVVNPSVATASVLTATISSPLTSAADITKSGRGTLILSAPALTIAGGGANKTTINEGILEIADLDNIGGGTGGLVLAGGTLRLGTTLTDDISTRAISYLGAGGTIDTNTVNLLLAGDIGTGSGSLTKAGAGNLTLSAVSTRTGNTTVSGGTLTLAANDAIGIGGALNVGAGATLDVGAFNVSVGLVTTSGASPVINGTGIITSSAGFAFNHTGNTSIGAVLAGSVGVLKTQTNEVTLTGANIYTGATEVHAGTLAFSDIQNIGAVSSNLGAPTTAENGMIRLGLTTATTAGLTYTGAGSTTDRYIALQGTTGGATINGNGTGALDLTSGIGTITALAKTVTLGGTSATPVNNTVSGVIIDGIGTLGVTKTGTNTWTFSGASANTYTGLTTVSGGILDLNKTAGVNAIVGDGIGTKLSPADVLINGGTLRLLANNQLDDTVFINQTSGVFDINGKTETFYNYVRTGGTYKTGRGSVVTIIDPTWGAGSTDILGNESYGNLIITDGVNTIHGDETSGFGGASVTVGAGGLEFQGNLSPSLILSSDYGNQANAGSLILNGNVSFTGTSGTAAINNGIALQIDGVTPVDGNPGPFAGTVNLGGVARTFTIANGSAPVDMAISARIDNGSLTKEGTGNLVLTGTNSYAGGTAVNTGTVVYRNTNAKPASGTTTVAAGATLGLGVATAGSFFSSADVDSLFAGTLSNVTNDVASNVGIDTTAGDFTYATSVPATTRGLTKLGVNTLTLSGLSSYTGPTAVEQGVLEVTGNTGGSTAAGTSVALGAALTGTGVISGATATHTVSGIVSPGTGPVGPSSTLGTLNFEAGSNLTFNPGSSAIFQIGDPTLAYDKIKTTGGGTLTLDAALTITVNGFNLGYTPVITDVWTLLDWGTIAGNGFNVGLNGRTGGLGGGTLDLPDVSSYGLFWEVGNFTTNGSISFAAIPEPGRVLLMFFGLAALFLRRRRSQA